MLLVNVCKELTPIIFVIKKVLWVIQFVIPMLLIILGSIDLGKAVISSDDKEVKAAQSRLIKRFIFAVAIFFVVALVKLVMGIVADGTAKGTDTGADAKSWDDCWDKVE